MQYNPPNYYRPFSDADDEAASRARSDSSMSGTSADTTDTEDTQVTATTGSSRTSYPGRGPGMDTGDTLDPRYQLIRAAGPEMASTERKNLYESENYAQYPFPSLPPFPQKNSKSLLQTNPARQSRATLFSINSENRDFQSFPYASYFTLQLPRTFKNVSAVNIIQISFPTLSGVIPDNTNAINLKILEEIIPTVFDISTNMLENKCEPPPTDEDLDVVTEIIDGTINPTPYLKNPYNLCKSLATAQCAVGVASCLDTIYIHENGRVNPARTDEILNLVYTIEPGRYISDTIVDALNRSMNSTFYFENITFEDYKADILAGQGAIAGFPYPNEFFYNNLTGRYSELGGDLDAARKNLATFYFPNIDTIFSTPPTNQEIFVSYYYPILKEVCINQNLLYLLNYGTYDIDTVYADVVTGFFGLNYQLYVDMCTQNVEFLTQARRYYTQEYYVVNQYTWYFNPNKNRIGVTFNTLNRGLKYTISTNYTQFFNQGFSFYDYSPDAYVNAQAALNDADTGLPVIEPMAALFSNNMGDLGVKVLNYTFDDISNNLTLYNTENTVALLPQFTLNQEKAGYTNQADATIVPNPNYGQWPNLIGMSKNYDFFQDLSASIVTDTNYPYSVDAEQFFPTNLTGGTRNFGIDASNNVFITNGLYTDIFVNIGRTRYVIIPFNTPNFQNVQISTLSRPYKYRYPAFNLSEGGGSSGYRFIPGIGYITPINPITFGGNADATFGPYDYFNYFDDSVDVKFNTINMTNYNHLYNISFHSTLQSALSTAPFITTFQTNFIDTFNYFRLEPPIQAPFDTYANPTPNVVWQPAYTSAYPSGAANLPQVSSRYLANLTIVPSGSSTFTGGLNITIYNDYSLFTADLGKGIANSPINYKYSFSVQAGDTSGTIQIPLYSHLFTETNTTIIPKYYYIKVSQVAEIQEPQTYQLALWGESEVIKLYQGLILPDIPGISTTEFSKYTWAQVYRSGQLNGIMSYWHAQVLDPDFNAAPITNDNNPNEYQFNATIPMSSPFIGHDQAGISTDLTDYRGIYLDASGYNPDAEYYADPVSGYFFKQLSDYSENTHTYFYSGSQNAVYDPNYNLYTFPPIPSTFKREFKFTHWWGTHYIGPQIISYFDSSTGTAIVPDLSCITFSQLQNYNQSSVALPGGPLVNYNYLDWGLYAPSQYAVISGQLTTLFDYNPPPFPPTYDNARPVIGFTFTLPDGIYKMKSLTFKSAWYGPESSDPNQQIQKIFIYNAGTVNLKDPATFYGGNFENIAGQYDASANVFNKDLTNITNAIIVCSKGEYLPDTPTVYNINVNNPFEGQNFLVINTDIDNILVEATFTDSFCTVPDPTSGNPIVKYFVYKNGRWNYYSTQDIGGFQYPIYSFDYNITPVAILSRRTNGQGRVSYGPGGNAVNPQADKSFGTYYTFDIDTSYSNPELFGATMPDAQYQTNFFSSYVAVAFSLVEIPSLNGGYSFFNAAPIWCLAGSLVPHPDYEDPQGSIATPVDPWPSTNGNIASPYAGQGILEQSMIIPIPNASPAYSIGNEYESQVGQSIPISTTGILLGATTPLLPFVSIDKYYISCQSFWPVQNIIFERVATTYKPMIELNTIVNPELFNTDGAVADLSGTFEYPRTQLFYYDNLTDLYADISDATVGYRWGFESRYKSADVSFNGYLNNSYIYNITPPAGSTGYLLLRAYSPAEQFQTMLRFAIKDTSVQANTRGLYTFGLKTTDMLTIEYNDYISGAKNITSDYATALTNFWQSFIGNFIFGTQRTELIGFYDITNPPVLSSPYHFLNLFRELWSNLQDSITVINNLDSYALTKINEFIQTRYGTVLPSNLLTYSALNGDTSLPVTFYGNVLGIQNSTPFVPENSDACVTNSESGACDGVVSAIQNSFACFPAGATIPTLEVQVGFPFATVTAVASLEGDVNNVINQNLYLQLNQEYTFNNMDVALKESAVDVPANICPPTTLSGVPSSIRTQNTVLTTQRNSTYKTKEFRGSSKIAMGKIILNNATDNVTQTLLQSPATFDPPLGKLDNLYFRVLTKDLYPVYQVYPYITPELEWNGVISITEEISNIVQEERTQIARVDINADQLPF